MSQPESGSNLPATLGGSEGAAIKAMIRPAALSATPGALCLLKAFQRRWFAAISLGLLLAVVLGGAAYLLVPGAKYTATATLHVSTKPKRIIFAPMERDTDFRTYQKTQITLLKNRKVLAHALAQPDVAGLETVREQVDPEEWLDLNLKAEFPGGSEVLQISLSGDRAADVAKIVNAVLASYMTIVVEEERRERVARLDALRLLRDKYEAALKLKRKVLRELASNVGVSDEKALALSQQFKVEHLGQAQTELMHAKSELLKAEAQLTVSDAATSQRADQESRDLMPPGGPAPRGAGGPVDASIDLDPRVRDLKQLVADLSARKKRQEAKVRNAYDPAFVQIRRQLADATRALDDMRRTVISDQDAAASGGLTADAELRSGDGMAALSEPARARAQVEVWRTYIAALSQEIARLQGQVKDTSDKGLDLENERGDITIATEVARKVGAELEAVEVELNAPERIQILAEAKVPNRKDELRKLKAAGGAGLCALAFGLLGMSFWEYQSRRVSAAQEIVGGLGMTLVGTVPASPRSLARGTKLVERRWQNRLVESVDAIRALLLHTSRRDGTQVVMVASALKGEGKTSLACHLATSLARSGRRTLLIDGDLRSPSCHRLFAWSVEPGLCEVLRGDGCFDDVVRESIHEAPGLGLSLLTAGRMDAMALQAISQDGFRHLLDELRPRYDFIIVDSAPVLPVADSLLLAQSVDAVIFAVMRDVSRLPMVYEANERLASLGVRVIGAVLAGVKESAHAYEYQSQMI